MNTDFYTNTHSFRRMEFSEIKELDAGDKIAICVHMDFPKKATFVMAIVVRPMFWNSDSDEPDWEVETNNGFVDIYSIYEAKEI